MIFIKLRSIVNASYYDYYVVFDMHAVPCKTLWEARLIARKLNKRLNIPIDIKHTNYGIAGVVNEHGELLMNGKYIDSAILYLMNENNPLDDYYEID
jgi:hypothetical protein